MELSRRHDKQTYAAGKPADRAMALLLCFMSPRWKVNVSAVRQWHLLNVTVNKCCQVSRMCSMKLIEPCRVWVLPFFCGSIGVDPGKKEG